MDNNVCVKITVVTILYLHILRNTKTHSGLIPYFKKKKKLIHGIFHASLDFLNPFFRKNPIYRRFFRILF